MERADRSPGAGPEPTAPVDLARLSALSRMAMGAAHALNNAFTVVLGEAQLLLEERREDPTVAESCAAMVAQLERCARLTRGLLARRSPSQAGSGEVDVVRAAGEIGALLRETLESRHRLELRLPDDLLPVPTDATVLELLLLGLILYAADHAGGRSRIALDVRKLADETEVALRLDVTAERLPEYVVEAFLDPKRAPDRLTRASLEAVADVVRGLGGSRCAAVTAPDAWAALVRLPLID